LDSKKRTSRSARVNTKRLIELRKLRGWTQVQLAEASGFSQRLILKAEAGAPIALGTIAALAQALSSDAAPLTAADLLRTTIEIAREFIQIMYRTEGETIQQARHLLAPDAEFRIWGESAGLPFAGLYRGLEEGEQLFRHFFSLIEAPPDHDPLPHYHLIADHENVVAWGHSYLRPRGQVEVAPMPISYLFSFRDDLIIYFEDRFDTTHGGQLLGTLPRPQSTSPD
jgi:transcriptional regulator with XRE-family HTH domain